MDDGTISPPVSSGHGTMSDSDVVHTSQIVGNDSIPNHQGPQIPQDGKCSRRRRRPKRNSIGCDLTMDGDDQWYDAPHQLLSSVLRTPVENDVSLSRQPLPLLLYERELYGPQGNCRQYHRHNSSWMRQMLSDASSVDPDEKQQSSTGKRFYYRYKQALKFCYLRTSIMDAVLGIEPHGNYVVAIGKKYHDDKYLLHLRLCGIPSCKNHAMSVAPLRLSIPLSESQSTPYRENSIDYWMQAAPELCPLRVWMSTDERFGACMYRTNESIRNKTANVVLFPLPQAISAGGNDYIFHRWNHVHVPCQSKQDLSPIEDCNLLMRVPSFPNHKVSSMKNSGKPWLCDTVTTSRGIMLSHLFLIDAEDGFHLTWIRESAWKECVMHVQDVVPLWGNSDAKYNHNTSNHDDDDDDDDRHCRPHIVRATEKSRIVLTGSHNDSGWQRMVGHPTTGDFRVSIGDTGPISAPFAIEFACFFSVAALLLDILQRRPRLVSPRFCSSTTNLPNYTYHLVHIKNGRVVEVLLVFAVGPIGRGCLGVFVEVDLFTQDYREIEWIKSPAHDSPPSSCAKLAFDRRRGQTNVQGIMGDNVLDVLYPDCVTMDNRAIRRNLPIMFMSARSANVTISYL